MRECDYWGFYSLTLIVISSFAAVLLQWTLLALIPVFLCMVLGLICIFQAAQIENDSE